MKKVFKITLLCLLCFITVSTFAQLTSKVGASTVIPQGKAPHATLSAIVEPDNSVFSYMPVGYENAFTSSASEGYKCYQSFSGATSSFDMITIWGVTNTGAATPLEFTVQFYNPGVAPATPGSKSPLGVTILGPGTVPGSLISSVTMTVSPELTGMTVYGMTIYCYHFPIASSSLTDGWVSIQATASNSAIFYWLDTFSTPVHKSFQNSLDLATYNAGVGLSMCLSKSHAVPVSIWSILAGFVLIGGAVSFRFWRKLF
jgi:hypothetical protein